MSMLLLEKAIHSKGLKVENNIAKTQIIFGPPYTYPTDRRLNHKVKITLHIHIIIFYENCMPHKYINAEFKTLNYTLFILSLLNSSLTIWTLNIIFSRC